MHAALVAASCRCRDGRAMRRVVDAWCAVGGASCGGPRIEGEERSEVEGEEGQERAGGRRRRRRGPGRGCQFCLRARKGAVARHTCARPYCEALVPLSWWERDMEVQLRRRVPQAAGRKPAVRQGWARQDRPKSCDLQVATCYLPTGSHFPATAPATREHVAPSLSTTS